MYMYTVLSPPKLYAAAVNMLTQVEKLSGLPQYTTISDSMPR